MINTIRPVVKKEFKITSFDINEYITKLQILITSISLNLCKTLSNT